MSKYLVCISGASGSVYGIRLMGALIEAGHDVHAVVSQWGAKVTEHETGKPFESWVAGLGIPPQNVYAPDDLAALPASGTFALDGTIVAPCSMDTVGAIAAGISMNLIHRAALVSLKEGRPLVLVPRETPLSLPALRSLCSLAEAGTVILPACTAFYHLPQTMDDMINFVIGKILDRLSISHTNDTAWKGLK